MFTFLNTIILSALALSLIPILIHLLNRKKSKLVLFSTLDFLKALQKKKMKRVKVQQVLLLILRTLIILLAVMAFARPVSKMENQGQIDAHAKTSVALIMDNNVGTSYVSDKGMVLDEIKNKAEQILNYLKEGDEAIILSSANSSEVQNVFTQNFTELKAIIRSMVHNYAKSNINEALYLANKSFASAKNVNREIYVLTAFQASNFNDEKVTLQSGVKLIFIDCSVKEFRNTGIRNAHVMSKIIEKNKPVEIRAEVKNFGKDRVQDVSLNVYLDGHRVGQSSLTINPEEESVVNLKIIPSKTGLLQGSIEIDDDAYAPDNKRYFHVFIPGQIKVLLVGNAGDTEFIRLALNPGSEATAPIQTRTVLSSQMAVENLNDYDVIVLSNVPRLDDALIRRIEAFLNSGKGLLMIPGSGSDITNHNLLLSKIGFGKIINLTDNSLLTEAHTKFGQIDYSHPIIGGMFDQNISKDKLLESPSFIKFFKLDPAAQSRTLISYTNNASFLEESASKGYSALLMTSAVDLSWSDWPLKGIFVPLINRSVYYLYSKNSGATKSYESGDLIELRLIAASGQDISVIDPDGVEIKPKVRQIGDDIIITVPSANLPGTYKIFQRGVLYEMFDVNVSTEQLELKKLDKKKLGAILPSNQYELTTSTDNIENIVLQSRYGVELWKWFVFGAIVLLIAEILIAQSHRFLKSN